MIFDFEKFNNCIINSPRKSFKNVARDVFDGIKISKMFYEQKNTIYIQQKDLFDFAVGNFAEMPEVIQKTLKHKSASREMRHVGELMSFIGIWMPYGKLGYAINISWIQQLNSVSDVQYFLREFFLNLNINSWSFMKRKKVKIHNNSDLYIATEIINYLEKNKVATLFELAVIFGYIDPNDQTHDTFKARETYLEEMLNGFSKEVQMNKLFDAYGWTGKKYKSSQNPDFKFKTFILLMEAAGLIFVQKSKGQDVVSLIPKIKDTISDVEKRAVRNQIIIDQRRAISNYLSEYSGKASFMKSDGRGYVEVHHIIPLHMGGKDVIENTISLTSDEHKKAHFSAYDVKVNFNLELRKIREITNNNIGTFLTDSNLLKDANYIELLKGAGLYD